MPADPTRCSLRDLSGSLAAALCLATMAVTPAAAATQRERTPVVSDLPAEGFIARTRSITLRISDTVDRSAHTIALFIDDTDVSAILRESADGWVYDAAALPLPAGEHELVAWLVESDSGWHEALRQTFRVPGAFGIEKAGVKPALDFGMKSRLASAFEPAVPGERETYNDFDGQFGIDTEIVRHGGLRFTTRSQFIGNSLQNRALRFGEMADDAPKVDLSSWVAQVRSGGVELALGNVSAGDARHLIQRFGSRGASLGVAAGSRVQLSGAAMHGSNLVGWDDLVGLGQPDHRVITGSIGVEALSQPGALRVEVTALDGSVLPRSGFNRGAITDAETSTGYALRVQSQALDRRLRLEGGFTRSTFDNPEDRQLGADTSLVPVERETRNARYLQTSLDLLRGIRLGQTRTARLTLGFEHERVDPLFRTVASYTRADQLENRWEARADVAGVTFAANHARSRNNLDEIESILTSNTHRTGFDVAIPLASVLRGRAWLPQFRLRTDRTHQFGIGVPANGGFSESHVPDQVSTEHTASLDVRIGRASLGYRLNLSEQDNRQTGRENADLERTTHGITAQATPLRVLTVNTELSWIDAVSRERDETDATRRFGIGVNWMPLPEAVLAFQLADTHAENDVRGSNRDDRTWSLQWSSPVPGLRRLGAKWLLRFARAENAASDPLGGDLRRENWMVDAGFNLSFR